ncbi:MAG: AAA family ATPase [Clostridiales bacterium]|nr:AAA family ATPase [Clostridiales bacterium]MDY3745170.1 AAA family ATPase [Lachnospiraceae bacterium]
MLERIVINNFKSFSRRTIIDFAKTNYTILPQNCTSDGILKGAMFVGANASGKSNAILAIKILLDLLFIERDINSGIFKCIFNTNPKYSLEYRFRIDGCELDYSFEVDTRKNIISEKLILDGIVLLDRLGTAARVYITDSSGTMYNENDVDSEILFLRTLYFNTRFAGNSVLKDWMDFLSGSVYINAFEKRIVSYGKQDLNVIHYLRKNGSDTINQFFNEYNFKQTIEYSHESVGKSVKITIAGDEDEKNIFFKRKEINEPIPFSIESTGNQNLLRMLPAFLSVVSGSGMLLIDEFSSGFHNELESLLIKYFMEKSVRSQLLFVSHSTNLLSNALLRPDQEYSVEFNGNMGTSLKRISSEQPRAAQNIEKMYVSGVFGGLPGYEKVEDEG